MLLEEVPVHTEVFIDSNIFIFQSRELRRRHLLMTNDSLNLHVMRSNQLHDIATNDGDFKRVEWVTVWKP
jgi:predicted nucleic acid-binding protein